MSEVTVWYLEQTERAADTEPAEVAALHTEEVQVKQFQFNRCMYQLVGGPWQWTDKLEWSDEQWRDYAERDNLRTWAGWAEGSPAGYFELEKREDGTVDIAYFGLSPAFIGRGFGGAFLARALQEAWNWNATRVTVNTCSLDHPRALENYRQRGFSVIRSETIRQ